MPLGRHTALAWLGAFQFGMSSRASGDGRKASSSAGLGVSLKVSLAPHWLGFTCVPPSNQALAPTRAVAGPFDCSATHSGNKRQKSRPDATEVPLQGLSPPDGICFACFAQNIGCAFWAA